MSAITTENTTATGHRGRSAIVLAATALLLFLFCLSPWFTRLEAALGLNWLFKWRGAIAPPATVTVVAINAETAARMGLPAAVDRWPHTRHAELITALQRHGAAAIAFDIAFIERGRQRRTV